jgi:hypothetical protein
MILGSNWDQTTKFAVGMIAVGGMWTLLLKWGIPNFRSFLFSVISDEKEGIPVMTRVIEKCLAERHERQDAVADAMDDMLGRMDAAEYAVKARSGELKRLNELTSQIPELTRILSEIKAGNESFGRRFEAAMDKFTNELAHVREGVARMEGKWDGIDRRDKRGHE